MDDLPISFDIPILGSSHHMSVDYVLLSMRQQKPVLKLFFFSDGSLFLCQLDKNVDAYRRIAESLGGTLSSPVFVEHLDNNRCILTMQHSIEDITALCSLLGESYGTISLEYGLADAKSLTGQYHFQRCDFHPFDIYELGYFSESTVVSQSLHDAKIFMGVFVKASNPFYRHPLDYMTLNFSNDKKLWFFLKLSLKTLCLDRPELMPIINSCITKMIHSISFRHKKRSMSKHLGSWASSRQLKIYVHEIETFSQWSPIPFLKHFSRALDIFPSYSMDNSFTITTTSTSTQPEC